MSRVVPLVSVIVPTHNRVSLLRLTLRSVLWQEGIDLEVLVVDDGSTEDVPTAVKEIGDARVRVLRHETPQGVSSARNVGVAAATGTWVAFIDDDDLWAPDKLISQVRAAEVEGSAWAYTGAVNVTTDLRLIGGAPPADPLEVVANLQRANLVPGGCSSVIVRRRVLPEEPFDRSLGTCADWDLWIRLSRIARPVGITRPLVGYRVHGTNMSLDIARTMSELAQIETRYGGPIDWARMYRYLARVSLRGSRHRDAIAFYCRAARADKKYRHEDFVPDLIEVAEAVERRLRQRVARALNQAPRNRQTRPERRYASEWEWVQQARPWLDELMQFQRE